MKILERKTEYMARRDAKRISLEKPRHIIYVHTRHFSMPPLDRPCKVEFYYASTKSIGWCDGTIGSYAKGKKRS